MTLVGFESDQKSPEHQDNKTYVMLSVQQQQSANYYHHQSHIGRGNVIVSADVKSENHHHNHQQQPSQMQQQRSAKRRAYGAANPPYGVVQPASVARRNARERNRVKQVNNGFATLRQHIPQHLALAVGASTAGTQGGAKPGNKKLSKVETLRMAVEYIRNLQTLLQEHQSLKSEDGKQISPKIEPDSDLENGRGYNNNNSDLGNESPLSGDDENNPHYHHQHHYQSHHHHHHHRQSPVYVTSTGQCSSDASSSPTPSYVSETSSAGSQGYGHQGGNIYAPLIENYENYAPVSPEVDEQLLDVITMWPY